MSSSTPRVGVGRFIKILPILSCILPILKFGWQNRHAYKQGSNSKHHKFITFYAHHKNLFVAEFLAK